MNYQQMTIVGKAYSPKVFTRKDGKEYIGFVVPTNVYRSAFTSGKQDSANTSWVHVIKERPSDYLKNLEKGDSVLAVGEIEMYEDNYNGRNIPVIAMTAFSVRRDAREVESQSKPNVTNEELDKAFEVARTKHEPEKFDNSDGAPW